MLPDTATRRDLTDENLILDVAAKIGGPERLAALYLLAKADALATGPAAWTSWRQTLVRELVGRVQRAFERGDMGAELAERLTDRDRPGARPPVERARGHRGTVRVAHASRLLPVGGARGGGSPLRDDRSGAGLGRGSDRGSGGVAAGHL